MTEAQAEKYIGRLTYGEKQRLNDLLKQLTLENRRKFDVKVAELLAEQEVEA